MLIEITDLNRLLINRVEGAHLCKQQTVNLVIAAVFFRTLAGMREIQLQHVVVLMACRFQRNVRMPGPAPQPAAGRVHYDGMQPGIDARIAAEMGEVGERFQDRLLHDIFRILLTARHAQGHPDQLRMAPFHCLSQGSIAVLVSH